MNGSFLNGSDFANQGRYQLNGNVKRSLTKRFSALLTHLQTRQLSEPTNEHCNMISAAEEPICNIHVFLCKYGTWYRGKKSAVIELIPLITTAYLDGETINKNIYYVFMDSMQSIKLNFTLFPTNLNADCSRERDPSLKDFLRVYCEIYIIMCGNYICWQMILSLYLQHE